MTLATALPRGIHIGNGTRGPFTMADDDGNPVYFETASHVVLTRYSTTTTDNVNGTVLSYGTDYTLSGVPGTGVSYTLTSSQNVLASSERIEWIRAQPLSQPLDLTNGGNFSSEDIETRLSKIVEQIQDVKAIANRGIKAHYLESTVPAFPDTVSRANNVLGFDANGKPVPATLGSTEFSVHANWVNLLSGDPAAAIDNQGAVRSVPSYTELDALTDDQLTADAVIFVSGAFAQGDGGEGYWRVRSGSTTPNVGTLRASLSGNFYFQRLYDATKVRPEWFGTSSDWAAAFALAEDVFPSGGGIIECLAASYSSATAIVITVGGITIQGSTTDATTFEFTHATNNGIHFNVGEASVANNMWLKDVTVKSTVTQTAGAAVRFDNTVRSGMARVRIFGDSKIWRAITLYSYTRFRIIDCDIANVRAEFLHASGASGTVSVVDGKGQDLFFEGVQYFYGCHTGNGAADRDDAGFYIGEYIEGVYNSGTIIAGSPVSGSVLVRFAGNSGAKSTAVELGQIELEAAAGAGSIYATNTTGITIDRGWMGGNNAVGVEFASSCTDIIIGKNVEIYADGATPTTACVVAAANFASAAQLFDYNGTTHTAYAIDHSTATDIDVTGRVSSFATGVSGSNITAQTRGRLAVDFGETNTTDLSGYDVAHAITLDCNSRQGPCTNKLSGGSNLANDNGDFSQWQRGTSFTNPGTRAYTADRWNWLRAGSTNNGTLTRQTGSNGYCARIQRDSGTSDTDAIYFAHDIKAAKIEALRLAGSRVVLRFRARAGADYSNASSQLAYQIFEGQGTDQALLGSGYTSSNTIISSNVTLTTSWQTFYVAFDLASSSTGLGVNFIFTPVGTAGAADYYEIEQVSMCDPLLLTHIYDARPSHIEEDNCRRYYQSATKRARNGEEYIDFIPIMPSGPSVAVGVGSASSVSKNGFLHTHSAAADLGYTATLEP